MQAKIEFPLKPTLINPEDGSFLVVPGIDQEGDAGSFERNLRATRDYFLNELEIPLSNEDFTVVTEELDGEWIRYIQLPELEAPAKVYLGNLGDTLDKGGRGLELIAILNGTNKKYPGQVIDITGNREITKLRLKEELQDQKVVAALAAEIFLEETLQKAALAEGKAFTTPTGAARYNHENPAAKGMVWVDGGRLTFLEYLRRKDKIPGQPGLANKPNSKLKAAFMKLDSWEREYYWLDWMQANSCGAPNFLAHLAKEQGIKLDQDTEELRKEKKQELLAFVKRYFCSENGPMAERLSNAQVAVVFGSAVLSHSGTGEKSCIIPRTLYNAIPDSLLEEACRFGFPKSVREEDATSDLIFDDLRALYGFHNYCLHLINKWRYSDKVEEQTIAHDIFKELDRMALREECNHGHTLINLNMAKGAGGTYGFGYSQETLLKFYRAGIGFSLNGHMPTEGAGFSNTEYFVQSDNGEQEAASIMCVRGDTGNWRTVSKDRVPTDEELAAGRSFMAMVIGIKNGVTSLAIRQRDAKGESLPDVTLHRKGGKPVDKDGNPLSKQDEGWVGCVVRSSGEQKEEKDEEKRYFNVQGTGKDGRVRCTRQDGPDKGFNLDKCFMTGEEVQEGLVNDQPLVVSELKDEAEEEMKGEGYAQSLHNLSEASTNLGNKVIAADHVRMQTLNDYIGGLRSNDASLQKALIPILKQTTTLLSLKANPQIAPEQLQKALEDYQALAVKMQASPRKEMAVFGLLMAGIGALVLALNPITTPLAVAMGCVGAVSVSLMALGLFTKGPLHSFAGAVKGIGQEVSEIKLEEAPIAGPA